jgi:hypothetical protein
MLVVLPQNGQQQHNNTHNLTSEYSQSGEQSGAGERASGAALPLPPADHRRRCRSRFVIMRAPSLPS